MKSIKEKAIELKTELLLNRATITEIYTAGAYYVLDEVKILLNSQRFVDNPSQELFELIEQLKK